jgi:hypothetical protein
MLVLVSGQDGWLGNRLRSFIEMKVDGSLTQTKSGSYTPQPDQARSPAVTLWHTLLRGIAVLNLALWAVSAVSAMSGEVVTHATTDVALHMQLLLSAVYMLGCGFRSFLPVYDIPRLVLVDSSLSSVVVGRSVATIAELSFAAQWALILHHLAVSTHSPFGQAVSIAIVPLIALAQCCCWQAVLTTAQRGHIVENSIWGVSAALVVISLLVIGPYQLAELYPPIIAWCIGGAVYVGFMFFSDVPMYWSRWRADQANGRQYLSLTQGLVDVRQRWTVSYRWEDWKSEVLWMSLYFSGGVWISISLIYASVALDAH